MPFSRLRKGAFCIILNPRLTEKPGTVHLYWQLMARWDGSTAFPQKARRTYQCKSWVKVPLDNIAKRAEEYKPKERVTYKMIKEYIDAKYGFKVHTAYIAEVKRDLGLPMYDAPNAVEELKQPRKHPTAEKVEAIKDALKHFKII